MSNLLFFRALSGLSIILCSVPAIWHWQHKNYPAIFLIVWINWFTVSCFVNSFIWPNDHVLMSGWDGGIYCDIQTKVAVGAFAGNLGALAAIARNLANILSDNITVVRTRAVRRKELIKDLLLCLGAPILMMLTHYFFQPTRYVIFAITGCNAIFDLSWLGIVLHLMWTPIQAVLSGYFAVLVIWRIHKHRRRFEDLLSNNSSLTRSRFTRLFILSVMLLVIEVPVTFYIFYLNLNAPMLPYDWDRVHGEGWLGITKIPTNGRIQFDRWIPVGTGFLVFAVFGLGKDAMTMYREWLNIIGIGKFLPDFVMGIKKERSQNGSGIAAQLSSWRQKRSAEQKTRRRDFYDIENSAGDTLFSNITMDEPEPARPQSAIKHNKTGSINDSINEDEPTRPKSARHSLTVDTCDPSVTRPEPSLQAPIDSLQSEMVAISAGIAAINSGTQNEEISEIGEEVSGSGDSARGFVV